MVALTAQQLSLLFLVIKKRSTVKHMNCKVQPEEIHTGRAPEDKP
jgi:hypothetical protein